VVGGNGSAPASGSPITVGYQIGLTGPLGTGPVTADVILAAQDWINAHGGIGTAHHVLNLVICDTMSSAAGAETCGTKFADDSSMVAVLVGASPGQSFYIAVDASHKPMLGVGTFGGPADASSDLYQFYPGNQIIQTIIAFVKSLPNLSSLHRWLTINQSGTPTEEVGTGTIQAALPNFTSFTTEGISTTTADMSPQLVAGHASTADLLSLSGNINCGLVGTEAKTLGIKLHYVLLTTPECVSPRELASSPSTYVGWFAVTPVKDAAADPSDPESAQFLAAWAKYYPGKTYPVFSEWPWGGALTFQNITNGLSESQLNSADITTAMANFKGPVSMGDQHVSCPTNTNQIICATGGIDYQFTSTGTLALVQYTSSGTVIVPGVNG
jgi:ABC-type branched-subunit amino acid transport system substrate-binding protein